MTFVKGMHFTLSEICTHKQTGNKMKNSIIVAAVTALFPLAVGAQQTPTLKMLIDSAMAQDYTLKEQTLENGFTKIDEKRLSDAFLPKIDITGKTGFLYTSAHIVSPEITIPAVKGLLPGATFPKGTFSNTFNITGISAVAKAEAGVLLYSGGKIKYLKQSNKEKDAAENILMQKSRDEVITAVSKAYDQFSLLYYSKLSLEQAKKRLDINRKTADKALGYGLITPYDHKKIELAQANLDSKIVEYEGKKNLLITQLYLLTGIDKEKISQIQPELVPINLIENTEDITKRAEIQALEHGIKAQDFKIKAEERWWVPKVQALTSLSYLGLYENHITTNKSLLPTNDQKLNLRPDNLNVFPVFQAGIGFKWDVFDGNEGKRATEKAKIEKNILIAKKDDAEKKLKLNLANEQTNFDIANSQIALKAKAKEIARQALENVEKEFRYGTKKSSDLIEAENDLQNAELEYETAIFNQRRSAVELMKATEQLDASKL